MGGQQQTTLQKGVHSTCHHVVTMKSIKSYETIAFGVRDQHFATSHSLLFFFKLN